MPERGFDTAYWGDSFVMKLSKDAKLLYIYLWTNQHCNQAGLYEIAPETIAFETKLAEVEISNLLESLEPKVKWYREQSLIWVKNFLRHQAKSPKFIIAAIKSLNGSRIPEEIRGDFEAYNEELLRGIAPSEHVSPTKRECVLIRDNFRCQYCGKEIFNTDDYEMDHIIPISLGGKENYLNLVAACRKCNQRKIDKTPGEAGLKNPTPTPFHGAQATYILRNNQTIREKWLKVFPDRYKVIESILININQYQPIITADTLCSSASADLLSSSGKKEGSGGKEDKALAKMRELYEQNIGRAGAFIADRLKELGAIYPVAWFEEAVREAVRAEHRNLKYIEAILVRWKTEGFKAPKAKGRKSEDPDKFIKGRHGHLVRR